MSPNRPSLRAYRFPLVWLLFVIALAPAAMARDIVVAKSGGEFDTVQAGLDAAQPGDSVLVRTGTYNEKVAFARGGTAGAGPIVLRNYAGESPVIDGAGVAGDAIVLIEDRSYVEVAGLELRGNTVVGATADGSGVRVLGAGSHLTIRDCRIHEIRGHGAMGLTVFGTRATPIERLVISGNEIYDCEPADSEALVLNGNVRDFEVTSNTVHDVNNIGIDFIGGEAWLGGRTAREGVCRGNTVYRARSSYGGGYAAGIYVDGGTSITLEANLVYECDLGMEIGCENAGYEASGIVVRRNVLANNDKAGLAFGGYAAAAGRVRRCRFLNNTVWMNQNVAEVQGELWVQYGSQCEVRNNIFVGGAGRMILRSDAGNTVNAFDNNLYWRADGAGGLAPFTWNATEYSDLAALRTATGQETHGLAADPLLSDPASRRFELLPASPCIDSGANVDLPFAGPAPDLGAFESVPRPGSPPPVWRMY